ncbi:MAG: hypothetical protein QXS76_03655 [Candidatus Bathyarchaeia archaeon]
MAYIIYARHPKYMQMLRTILLKNGFFIVDTEFRECVIVVRDPSPFIPREISKYVDVAEIHDYARFLKGFNSLLPVVNPALLLKEGDTVRIKRTPYEGLTGVIKKLGKRTAEVEVSIFGRIVKERFKLDELERIEQKV